MKYSGSRSVNLAVALVLAPLIFCGVARAQDIAWGQPKGITGTSDISKRGTYADAIQTYGGSDWGNASVPASAITIGDTTFNAVTATPTSFSDGKMISYAVTTGQLYFTSSDNPTSGWNRFPTASPSSDDYSKVVSNGVYITSGNPNGTVTLSGLKAGQVYEVQVWNFVQDGEHSLTVLSGKTPVTLDNLAGVPASGPLAPGAAYGQFVLGTFTARSATETFDWSCSGGSYALLGSIALRDVTNASSSP
jgi:hypothetical protein